MHAAMLNSGQPFVANALKLDAAMGATYLVRILVAAALLPVSPATHSSRWSGARCRELPVSRTEQD